MADGIVIVGLPASLRLFAGAPARIDRALRRAINATVRTARTRIGSQLRTKYKLPSKITKARLVVSRASKNRLEGRITAVDGGISLFNFDARQTRNGVTFIARDGRRELMKAAFIHTTRLGKVVLQRKSDPGRPSGHVGRLPVLMRYGPSMPDLLGDLLETLEPEIQDAFARNFASQLRFEFR